MSLEVHFSGFTQQNAVSLEEPFSSLLLFLQPEQQPPQLTPPQLCNKTRTFPLMMISSVVDFVGCRSDIGNCIHREYRNIFLSLSGIFFRHLNFWVFGSHKGRVSFLRGIGHVKLTFCVIECRETQTTLSQS